MARSRCLPGEYRATQHAMQLYSNRYELQGDEEFTIMSGGHEDFGGAQYRSIAMHLQKVGSTKFSSSKHSSSAMDPAGWVILKVLGGAEAGDVYNALERMGWAFLGPCVASIGLDGFFSRE
ncbi:FAD-binding domain containing protein [Penicillium waksmanii]|uniref:FAD-binding domain containing protein n=1 Tax=Penicillium waksmanii TaxID=69791 RepID=UPI00254663E1|nr:FAD-binding domain containing protein [Penicillium waksmanii]KAJ5974091.1 FAD-binding domain containing protein [Penicillium waksmanii]